MTYAGTAGAPEGAPVTIDTLRARKRERTPIVMSTAYDAPTARLVDEAGVDAILVGDSLGMVVLGYSSTLAVTVDDMVSHTAAVVRGATRALVVADMPFMSWQADPADGMRSAGRLIAEGGAHAVKLEGAAYETLEVIDGLTAAGVPVMGHVGLTPQSVNAMSGYRVQGREAARAAAIMAESVALQDAGAFAVVLECVPAPLAERITSILEIPTIGIGAGAGCDGQVQVLHDLVGLGGDHLPRHAARFGDAGSVIRDAVAAYAHQTRAGEFPTPEQSTEMDAEQLAEAEILFAAACEPDEPCEDDR